MAKLRVESQGVCLGLAAIHSIADSLEDLIPALRQQALSLGRMRSGKVVMDARQSILDLLVAMQQVHQDLVMLRSGASKALDILMDCEGQLLSLAEGLGIGLSYEAVLHTSVLPRQHPNRGAFAIIRDDALKTRGFLAPDWLVSSAQAYFSS